MKFDKDKPLPQVLDYSGSMNPGFMHCEQMDIATRIVKIDNISYLANTGLAEFGLWGPPILQIQKEITHCPACNKFLEG